MTQPQSCRYGPQLDGCVPMGNASGPLPVQPLVEITRDDFPAICADPVSPSLCRLVRFRQLVGKGILRSRR